MSTAAPPWPVVVAEHPVIGRVPVPGSKSLTTRNTLLAALADGPVRLRGALVSRDTRLMLQAVAALGVGVEVTAAGGTRTRPREPGFSDLPVEASDWELTPPPSGLRGDVDVDTGLAGTVLRFVPALAGLAWGPVRLDGDAHARERPLLPLLTALRDLGVRIQGDRLPLVVHGTGRVRGGDVTLDSGASSQFVSALLLAGARYEDGVRVHPTGRTPSRPHLDMTLAVLREVGVTAGVTDAGSPWWVRPGPVPGFAVDVEPDLSNAAPYLAAAVLTGGHVVVPDWPRRTHQPGDALRGLLGRLGARVEARDDGLHVSGTDRVRALDVDLGDVGELTPTIAALCAFADGPSRLRGIGHLRGHETDRLRALATELGRVGVVVEEQPDGLVIEPAPNGPACPPGTRWRSYADHRMATAGAVVGLRCPGLLVEDIATTDKTLPGFPTTWVHLVSGAADRRSGT